MNSYPNILVTGTPGTGKSTICKNLLFELKEHYDYLNVGDYVKAHKLYDEYDEARNCLVINEDALIDHLDDYVKKSNKSLIFDYHGCGLFLPEWFKAIFVLRTTNDLLYDRLKARNYAETKISENIQCEIFQVILDEAREDFADDDIEIVELNNNTEQDQKDNVVRIINWIKSRV